MHTNETRSSIASYQFFHNLTKLKFIEEIWLYGSRARGAHKERSDFDIAIIAPSATYDDWRKVTNIIEDADTLLKIDCVHFNDLLDTQKIKQNILRDKKIVYKRIFGTDMANFSQDYSFQSLDKAMARFGESLIIPDNSEYTERLQDGAIQRFEFTIELYWKVLKKILLDEKAETTTPKDTLSKAFQFRLIDDEKMWLAMLDDRNKTSHLYDFNETRKIFENIKTYYPIMQKTYIKLKEKFYAVQA